MQNIINKVKKGSIVALVAIGASSIVLTVYRLWLARRIKAQMEKDTNDIVGE